MCKSCFTAMSLMLVFVSSGCVETKTPSQTQTPAATVPQSAPVVSDKGEDVANKPGVAEPATPDVVAKADDAKDSSVENQPAEAAPDATIATKNKSPARPFEEAAFLSKDVVGMIVVHPKQILSSAFEPLLAELGLQQGRPMQLAEVWRRTNLKLGDVERVTLVVDQNVVNSIARQAGLPLGEPRVAQGAFKAMQMKNNLKQFALAFHNYHDVSGRFPRADGDGLGKQTGLSWRVHLLPFLDQGALYNKFHLDEAWDSEHNKTLIDQMPDIFRSPSVTDEGKTSFHVFTGEKTLFHGEQGVGLRDITDGSSNTILTILAGADTAEIWTKPGGLEVDLDSPKKVIGEIEGDWLLVGIADGTVRELPISIDDTTLAYLIQPNDGHPVDVANARRVGGNAGPGMPQTFPLLAILALSEDVQPDEIVKGLLDQSSEETVDGQTFHKNKTTAVWFPDNRTVITGPIKSVKQMISTKQSGQSKPSPLIEQLQLGADFTLAIDLESQSSLVQQISQASPMLGMINNIKTVAAEFSVTGQEGDSLVEINVTALDAQLATALSAMATMGLGQGKMLIEQQPLPPNANASDKEMNTLIKQLASSATAMLDGDKIQIRIPVPKGFDRVPVLLKPALMAAREAAVNSQQMNTLKQIGLAFFNFESAYSNFPGAGRIQRDKPVGLSWRVYLLPFLDQANLYSQFKLDEPWDSEHNKTLIEKMPEIFRSPGVDAAGKTSFHVFIGPGSPFEKDQAPGIADFTDGTSNTLLAVLAGPDTAEVWTKPGGLDFDPDDPLKSLGNFVDPTFTALMADGSVRRISKSVDANVLRRLIQFKDGEAVELP